METSRMKTNLIGSILAGLTAVSGSMTAFAEVLPTTLPAKTSAKIAVRADSLESIAKKIAHGEGWELQLQRDNVRVRVPFYSMEAKTDLEAFITAMRNEIPARTIKSGELTYKLEWNKLTADGDVVYDLADDFRSALDESEASSPNNPGTYITDWGSKLTVTSITGELVTYLDQRAGRRSDETHSFASTGFRAVRSDSGENASILDYAQEASLVDAFKKSRWINVKFEAVGGSRLTGLLKNAKSWSHVSNALRRMVKSCDTELVGRVPQSSNFAIVDYKPQNNRMTIRMGITSCDESSRRIANEIDLDVDAKPEFAKVLKSLKETGEGLFMKGGSGKGRQVAKVLVDEQEDDLVTKILAHDNEIEPVSKNK